MAISKISQLIKADANRPPVGSPLYHERNGALFTERIALVEQIKTLRVAVDDGQGGSLARLDLVRAERRIDDLTAEIVSFNYGLLKSYVNKFTTTSRDDVEEYEAAGLVGMMRAIASYNPELGKFANWAHKPIKREVQRAVRDSDHPNLNPGDFERRPAILRAQKELQAVDPHSTVTYEAIAALAECTIELVTRVLDAPYLESLTTPIGQDGDTQLGDLLPDNSTDLAKFVLDSMVVDSFNLYGLTALDSREVFVMSRRFGLDSEKEQCLSSIGEMLNLSREAVRQIESKARAKLNHPTVLRRLVRQGR